LFADSPTMVSGPRAKQLLEKGGIRFDSGVRPSEQSESIGGLHKDQLVDGARLSHFDHSSLEKNLPGLREKPA
jgi:hypothetical protein